MFKKNPTNMFKKNPTPKASPVTPQGEEIVSEPRPGGMCDQRRDSNDEHAAASGPIITTHGPVPVGELKGRVSQKTGLEREKQNLSLRGKEKEDEQQSKEISIGEVKENNGMEAGVGSNEVEADAGEIGGMSPEMAKSFAGVKAEVERLLNRVSDLDESVNGGTKVSDMDIAVSTELLMRQLLKLDDIEAEGKARMERKDEVCHVQKLLDTLDNIKEKNSNLINNDSNGVASQNSNSVTCQNSNGVASQNGNAVSVATESENLDSGVGSLTAPTPMPSSTEVTEEQK